MNKKEKKVQINIHISNNEFEVLKGLIEQEKRRYEIFIQNSKKRKEIPSYRFITNLEKALLG